MDCGSSGGSGTWSRSGPPKKEELVGGKKKGRTWGPSSTLQKERAGGEERYGCTAACPPLCLPNPCPDAISLCPAGSRPWGKEASSGPQAPQTWANPPSTPLWPQALRASMRWVRECGCSGEWRGQEKLWPREQHSGLGRHNPEEETAAPGLGVGAHFQKQGFGERDLRVTSSGICRVGILLLEVIGGSPCHQVWGKVRKGGISRVMYLSGCRRVCGGR